MEIGVWRGGTGCLMAKRVAPDQTVFLCDTFAGVVGVTDKDPSYSDAEHADTSQQIVTALAAQLAFFYQSSTRCFDRLGQ
jgi:O-methyltransferase